MDINDLTELIIGAAIAAHRELGPGLLESIYEECVVLELSERGLRVERQRRIPIMYKGKLLPITYRIDLIVEDRVIVELKSVTSLNSIHDAQVLTYLRLTGYTVGLLINFNVPLLKKGIRRLVLGLPEPSAPPRLRGENIPFSRNSPDERLKAP